MQRVLASFALASAFVGFLVHGGKRGKGRHLAAEFWQADSDAEATVRLGGSSTVRDWVALQVSHPMGRNSATCASGCSYMVHSSPLYGGYCCGSCCLRHQIGAQSMPFADLEAHGPRCERTRMESSDQPTAIALPCSQSAFSEAARVRLSALGVEVPMSPANASVLPVPVLKPLYDDADNFDSGSDSADEAT